MEEEIYNSLCIHYNDLLQPPEGAIPDCVDKACNVLSNVSSFRRETVLLSITTLTQHLTHYPMEWRVYLRDGILMTLVRVLSHTSCRFILHASRNLIITLHRSLLQLDITEEELAQLVEPLTILQKTSMENRRDELVTAGLEIVSHAFSALRKLAADERLFRFLKNLLIVFEDLFTIMSGNEQLPFVSTCAAFHSLGKLVKLSHLPAYDWLAVVCLGHLRGEMVHRLLASRDLNENVLLLEYLKCCRLMLKPGIDTEIEEHSLTLSQFICGYIVEKLKNLFRGQEFQNNCQEEMTHRGQGHLLLIRSTVHVLLLAYSQFLANSKRGDEVDGELLVSNLSSVHLCICQCLGYPSSNVSFSLWFFHLFIQQDDAMVDSLMVLLELYSHLSSRHSMVEKDWFSPWKMFSTLIGHLSHDPSVLLDLITSPETQFLHFFLSFLHHVISFWDKIALNFVLDSDFVVPEEVTGPDVEIVSLTSGLEQLMTYDEESSESSEESNSDTSDNGSEEPSLQSVMAVLEKLHQRLIQMAHKNVIHFNTAPLIALLGQVNMLAVKTGVLG